MAHSLCAKFWSFYYISFWERAASEYACACNMGNMGSTTVAGYLGLAPTLGDIEERARDLAPLAKRAFMRGDALQMASDDARRASIYAFARIGAGNTGARVHVVSEQELALGGAASLDEVWLEFLAFLALHRTIEDGETLSPPPAVDATWHHVLLYTSEYAALCTALAGRFVHHYPERAQEPRPAYERYNRYKRAYALRKTLGGGVCPPASVWPEPRDPLDFGSSLPEGLEC